MLSLCFAVPNEDTNLTAVDLSSSIHAPLAGCDSKHAQKITYIFAIIDKRNTHSD